MKQIVAFLFGISLLVGCTSVAPERAYVEAELATYNVVAPAHKNYVAADESLSDEQKEDRFVLLESWKARLDAAIEALDEEQ